MADVSLLFSIMAKDETAGALGSAGGRMDKFKSTVNKASIGIAGGLLAAAPAMVGLSRRITDLDAKSKTVFGKAEADVQKWAEANKAAMGMSSRETVALATNMGDLLKPMGFTSAEAANQSTKMLDLSGALSSWSGGQKSAAEVSDLLTDAMLGETDGLKALGISLSADEISSRLAKEGKDKLKGAALDQAKALVTQKLIMEKSTDAQDRWKNGAKDAAEAQNAGKVAMQEAKEALATALTPAIEKGTKMLAGMAKWVGENEGKVKFMATAIAGLAGVILTLSVGFKVVAAVTKAWALAMRLLSAMIWANPIFLIAGIIIGIGLALVIAYKKCEWFRKVVDTVFRAIGGFITKLKDFFVKHWDTIKFAMVKAVQIMGGAYITFARGVLGIIEGMLRAASKLPKWLGGGKFDAAADAVGKIRAGLQSMKDKLDAIPNSKKMEIALNNSQALARIKAVAAELNKIKGVTNAYVNVNTRVAAAEAGGSRSTFGGQTRASGGPVSPGEPYLVGEKGPEIVTFGHRGFVHPNKGGSGGGSRGGGGQMLDLTINLYEDDGALKKKVRKIVRLDGGGNVQMAFGGRA